MTVEEEESLTFVRCFGKCAGVLGRKLIGIEAKIKLPKEFGRNIDDSKR